ncbi:MAG TPA: uroporphyrinogen decarboxylase [Thermoanaerobaculia bacterium]|jgi:uroporphyrinogen decarboxylase
MDASTPSAARFLDACAGRAVDRPPVWMMRQAGRYLPEYREARARFTFSELCRSSGAAVEVSLQPFRRFRPDAVIFFSDILLPVEAMGVPVEFADGGPRIAAPVRSASDVDALRAFDPAVELSFQGEILRALRREVGDSAAVLGFCGAPWTMASYMVEGGVSRSFSVLKEMMGRDPALLRRLLDFLADRVSDVLSHQIDAGAQAIQIFDTWAGELSTDDYRAFALPALRRAIDGIRRIDQPLIVYVNGSGHLIEALASSTADVLSVDWRTPLTVVRRRAPGLALQGNLDPGALLGDPDEVMRRTRRMIGETGGHAHIVNLGHGVLPGARLECVEAFFEAARRPLPARGDLPAAVPA